VSHNHAPNKPDILGKRLLLAILRAIMKAIQMKPKRLSDWLSLAARLFLAVVFLYASVDKILHPAEFAKAVYLYQILPGSLINLAALILPWLELVLGLCLAAGIWLPGAVLWSNALLGTFFAALVFNVIRGLNIHCGCFSTSIDPAGAWLMTWYLFRDASFLLAGGYLMVYLFWIPQLSEDATGDGEGSSSG